MIRYGTLLTERWKKNIEMRLCVSGSLIGVGLTSLVTYLFSGTYDDYSLIVSFVVISDIRIIRMIQRLCINEGIFALYISDY